MVIIALILFIVVKKVYDTRNRQKETGQTQATEWDDYADDFVYLT